MDVASAANDLLTCPNCGEANPARFRLCGFCRTELGGDRATDEIRRYVTVVNSDLKGSTALGERLDPESLREVLTRYYDEMQLVFEAYGGTIEKIIGDAVVAVFGMPVRRDDDAWACLANLTAHCRVELCQPDLSRFHQTSDLSFSLANSGHANASSPLEGMIE